jgi:hypothetical protein
MDKSPRKGHKRHQLKPGKPNKQQPKIAQSIPNQSAETTEKKMTEPTVQPTAHKTSQPQ